MINKNEVKIVRELGKLPPFEWTNDTGVYLRFEAPMKSIMIEGTPAVRCIVRDLETDAVHSLLAQTVLESTLVENYPNATYVGKNFLIKRTKQEDKRYYEFDIKEISL